MAFPTVPAEWPFTWADTGTVTVPSGPERSLGWTAGEAPPFDWFNWLGNRAGQGFDYLKTYVDVEHNPADGTHVDVHAEHVTITASTRVAYDPVITEAVDLGSPDKGGWTQVQGAAATLNWSAAPPHTLPPAGITAPALVFMRPLDMLHDGDVINAFGVVFSRVLAGTAVLSYSVFSESLTNSTAGVTVEYTKSLGSTAGAWSSASYALGAGAVTISSGRRYWVEVYMVQGAVADIVRLASLRITDLSRASVK